MKIQQIAYLLIFFLLACQPPKEPQDESENMDSIIEKDGTQNWETYQNNSYNFTVKHPPEWNVHIDSMPPNNPIINIYSSKGADFEMPLTFHSSMKAAHVSIFPHGLATEGPSGGQTAVNQFNGNVPVAFPINEEQSNVYLLGNGEVWGYILYPTNLPTNWNQYGFVFAQFKVNNFSTACFDEVTGEEIDMAKCDPLTGDSLVRMGNVVDSVKISVNQVLKSFHLFDAQIQK